MGRGEGGEGGGEVPRLLEHDFGDPCAVGGDRDGGRGRKGRRKGLRGGGFGWRGRRGGGRRGTRLLLRRLLLFEGGGSKE